MSTPDERRADHGRADHGRALAAADERLNQALRTTDGDEVAAYDLLLAEDAEADADPVPGSTAG